MNTLIWKLLRQHISIGQLCGFFLANLFGMMIVLLGIQFYRDVLPAFTKEDSFMKNNYVVVTKKISTLSGLVGRNNAFSKQEIEEMKQQPFTNSVGAFTPSMFKVSASIGMQQLGVHLSTEMFFESVPDKFIDVKLGKWGFDARQDETIPIIIPRSYLNLYNFGFAQSRNLPKLSDGLLGLIQLNITLSGNGQTKRYKGAVVGFSNRLNTILVPEAFMEWANRTLAPNKEVQPARLIVEVKNPTDPSIGDYFKQKGYETEGENLDAGKATYFLRVITGIVLVVGLIISILSFYILMLSIFLLLQKNTVKLENLLLLGFSPAQVALPYQVLATSLNLAVTILAIGGVAWIRTMYESVLHELFPQWSESFMTPCLLTGIILFVLVSILNIVIIRRKIFNIRMRRK